MNKIWPPLPPRFVPQQPRAIYLLHLTSEVAVCSKQTCQILLEANRTRVFRSISTVWYWFAPFSNQNQIYKCFNRLEDCIYILTFHSHGLRAFFSSEWNMWSRYLSLPLNVTVLKAVSARGMEGKRLLTPLKTPRKIKIYRPSGTTPKKIVVDLKQKVYIFNIIKCYSILCWEVDRHSLHD